MVDFLCLLGARKSGGVVSFAMLASGIWQYNCPVDILVNVHGKPHTGGALSGQQAEGKRLQHGETVATVQGGRSKTLYRKFDANEMKGRYQPAPGT